MFRFYQRFPDGSMRHFGDNFNLAISVPSGTATARALSDDDIPTATLWDIAVSGRVTSMIGKNRYIC